MDSTAPPGSATTGTRIAVNVADLDRLEAETTVVEALMQAHLDDAGAHVPHGHPHSHGGGPPAVFSAVHPPHHGHLRELLAEAIALLVPMAQAQTQPPPLRVYNEDMGGPNSPAPTTPGTSLTATLDTSVPPLTTARDLIARLDRQIRAHARARPAHAHDHPHSH